MGVVAAMSAVMLGCMLIADALGHEASNDVNAFMGTALIVFFAMDVIRTLK